jgi:NADH:ubiquinone oxidoreductase subunit 4 (subunit M)
MVFLGGSRTVRGSPAWRRSDAADSGVYSLDDAAGLSGPANPAHAEFKDMNWWESVGIVPLAVCSILFGVLPMIAIKIYLPSTQLFLNLVENFK